MLFGGFSGRFITGLVAASLGWRHAFVVLAVMELLGRITYLAPVACVEKLQSPS